MTKSLSFIGSAIVALALASPAPAVAQAARRGGSSAGTSSGARTGPSGGGGVAVPRSAPRVAPIHREPATSSAGVSGRSSTISRAGGIATTGLRTRDGRPVRGTARARGSVLPSPGSSAYWRSWYPSGYYSRLNLFALAPWGYSSLWSPYGYGWYSPYGYDPFGYLGYWPYAWSAPAVGYSSRDGSNSARDDEDLGALRLRVDPKEAKVYVDGALAGVVDDFDGLTNHLDLPAGRHQLELRADGYQPYSTQVEVEAGHTRTERAHLKKLN